MNRVQQLGGQVAFDYQFDANMLFAPVWLIDLIGKDYMLSVTIVNFEEGSDPTNDGIFSSLANESCCLRGTRRFGAAGYEVAVVLDA